nr:hypothetical protein [Tanacetum cinerariifolium]
MCSLSFLHSQPHTPILVHLHFPIFILQLWAIPLEMHWSSTFKTAIPLRIFPIVPLSICNVSVARTSAVAGKVPYLVALVALLSTWAIVMKMAIGAEFLIHQVVGQLNSLIQRL